MKEVVNLDCLKTDGEKILEIHYLCSYDTQHWLLGVWLLYSALGLGTSISHLRIFTGLLGYCISAWLLGGQSRPTQLANYWIICTSDNKLGLRKLLTVNLYDARRKEKSITFFLHEVTFGGSKFSSLMFLWPMTLTWPPLPTFYLWNNSVLHHYLRICSWSGAHFPDFHTWDSLLGCLVSAWLGH